MGPEGIWLYNDFELSMGMVMVKTLKVVEWNRVDRVLIRMLLRIWMILSYLICS